MGSRLSTSAPHCPRCRSSHLQEDPTGSSQKPLSIMRFWIFHLTNDLNQKYVFISIPSELMGCHSQPLHLGQSPPSHQRCVQPRAEAGPHGKTFSKVNYQLLDFRMPKKTAQSFFGERFRCCEQHPVQSWYRDESTTEMELRWCRLMTPFRQHFFTEN